jgi:2'-5' RNA ligase
MSESPTAPDAGEGARQRLFFALWPDAAARQALADLARAHLPRKRGRPVPAENLHVTLVFLGSVDANFRRCAESAAEGLEASAFDLRFERMGFWPRPRVLWSAPLETPVVLARLASALSRSLIPCGHRPEKRAFSAHLTLARKVQGPMEERCHAPVHWHVDAFHLVASETRAEGARYRIVRSWPLE